MRDKRCLEPYFSNLLRLARAQCAVSRSRAQSPASRLFLRLAHAEHTRYREVTQFFISRLFYASLSISTRDIEKSRSVLYFSYHLRVALAQRARCREVALRDLFLVSFVLALAQRACYREVALSALFLYSIFPGSR
jgi:hypothetical protein